LEIRGPSFGMGWIEVDDSTWTTGEITRTSIRRRKGLAWPA
jgi:hypothetical protein